MHRSNSPQIQVLLVEDSADDAELMTAALKEGNLPMEVVLVEDGEAALQFLRRDNPHEGAPRPSLILLDLHLPRKNGYEVLTELKQDPQLRYIPVVVLTFSDNEEAFVGAYNLHANCCVAKPVDQREYAQVVKKIEHFWLHVAQRLRRA